MSYNKIIESASVVSNFFGILFSDGVKGTITHNEVTGNICNFSSPDVNTPDRGSDWFTEVQAFGIDVSGAGDESVISSNYVSNNDIGIALFEGSGCCIIDHNKLTDNPFFGIVIDDSEHTISNTKIFGGNIGVAAIA